MRLLVLGGTAWLGGQVAGEALAEGHEVVCLARGVSGAVPPGARLVTGDRDGTDGYGGLEGDFDAVVDVARDPRHVRTATTALAGRVGHWVLVSSGSVYAADTPPGSDESGPVVEPWEGPWSPERYGEGKVACERHLLAAVGADRVLVARAGLLAGPGDPTDRVGYWPLRMAHPAADDGSVLVVDRGDQPAQVLDVRDLATWLVRCARDRVAGTVDAVGHRSTLGEVLAACGRVAGHDGPWVRRSPAWLERHGVSPWSGPRSLPLWLPDGGEGLMGRAGTRAVELGLRGRPLEQTLEDVLAWELRTGPGRPRAAGLAVPDERELLALPG